MESINQSPELQAALTKKMSQEEGIFEIGKLMMMRELEKDKALKYLLLIHGIFFISCLIMPMTGIFAKSDGSSSSIGGVIALEIWCAYFLPIGILSYSHFKNNK